MKIAIVGSRDYSHPERIAWLVAQLPASAEVISGGARGVDRWAEQAAYKRGLPVHVYRADWKKHGKRAGFIRNQLIVEDADRVVAFWDERSRGTAHTMRLAKLLGKPLKVYGQSGVLCA